MKGKAWPVFIILLAVLGLVYQGCSGTENPIEAQENTGIRIGLDQTPEFCGVPQDCILTAGQNIEVGTVTIGNDEDTLYVTFNTTDGWVICETHVHVADSLDGIPQTGNGNPIPGQFDYSTEHDPPVDEVIHQIDISGFDPGDTLYVATHAVVKFFFDEENYQEETAWCGLNDFPGNRWGTYSTYEVQECCCEVDIPNDDITACFSFPGANSYWSTTLSGVPAGYDVSDGNYLGWCIQQFVFLTPGCHTVNLWSTVDPNLPAFLQDPDFKYVNWILNNKDECPNATKFDIQDAIWFFVDGGIFPSDLDAQCFVNLAQQMGQSFCPGPDEIIMVIVEAGPNKQRTLIETTCTD